MFYLCLEYRENHQALREKNRHKVRSPPSLSRSGRRVSYLPWSPPNVKIER